MDKAKAKILILVEGEKTEKRLTEHLFQIYGIDAKFEIVSYKTNIYVLYQEMFFEGKPEDLNTLQVLKEHERDENKKRIFDQPFTDIMLIFDLDPQDPLFSEDKIAAMTGYFTESTDMGKLYLNYPMIEAFYHMKAIPDSEYNERFAPYDELRRRTYKQRVNLENRNRNYLKFAVNREECNIVIKQNIEKGWRIINANPNKILPDGKLILNKQLYALSTCDKLYVLCTSVYFIVEYNPKMLMEHS